MASRLLLVPLVVIGLLLSATPAPAATTAKVDGDVIKINIVVDVFAGENVRTGPDGSPIDEYFKTVLENTWGAAFDKLPFKNCFKLELALDLKLYDINAKGRKGSHKIYVGTETRGWKGVGWDGAPETTRNSKTGDGTRSFENDRKADIPVNAPPTVVAHEFGHLMGLGDDREDGAPKSGRDGTMMVGGVPGVDTNVVQKIDQNLIDRIGEAIKKDLENQGKKVPKCETWTGTMNHTITTFGPYPNPCGEPQLVEGNAVFVVAPNGKVTGTYDVTGCNISQPHAQFTGTETDKGFSFPDLIVQTNGELIKKVNPTRARATLRNLQGTSDNGAQWVTKWDMDCIRNCGEAEAVG